MTKHHALSAVLALSLCLLGTAITSGPVQAKDKLKDVDKVKVRGNEERRLASLDKDYGKQMKNLAKQYKETAKTVKDQGGDPQPLLEAAAYFDGLAKDQDKKEKNVKKEKKVK